MSAPTFWTVGKNIYTGVASLGTGNYLMGGDTPETLFPLDLEAELLRKQGYPAANIHYQNLQRPNGGGKLACSRGTVGGGSGWCGLAEEITFLGFERAIFPGVR